MTDARVPGDKSISHRFLILAALAEGDSRLSGVPASLDVASTISCLRALGVTVDEREAGVIRVARESDWRPPLTPLDCGNSGTTARLLIGLLAGLGVGAELGGDESLMSRPMDRVVYPLQAMGARINYADRLDRLPVRLEGRASGDLRALRYRPRVSSAQVRGALLLAALTGRQDVEILDRLRPRDHTERILRSMGAPVVSEAIGSGERVHFPGASWSGGLAPLDATVPGDISSAAFMVAAALLTGTELAVRSVGLNPTRTAFLRVVQEMGVKTEVRESGFEAGEPVGDLMVSPSQLTAFVLDGDLVPQLIDEIPVLAVLASRAEGISEIRGAGELRVKESDRLALLSANFRALGVRCEELPDGLLVHGSSVPLRGVVRTGGDHRIAMAFGALGAAPGCEIEVDDRDCVNVSFPGFWDTIGQFVAVEEAP
ncbi:MAG: 3-phosphoshikimate 1-carboxyvinyltransferase [Gemmatimonadetes bacterium]|nr:3-phosphoshikimate 1-carboxyvinyltransferase [Gemmatimonadota bacterium]